MNRDSGEIANEVIQHLVAQNDANVEIVLEIKADIPQGAEDDLIRTVTENCRVLKFKDYGFEEE